MMTLLEELKELLLIDNDFAKVNCRILEDNSSCIELVNCPKMRPTTKHIGLKYHHFRSKVQEGLVTIKYIDTMGQIADIFAKALPEPQFLYLRGMLNG